MIPYLHLLTRMAGLLAASLCVASTGNGASAAPDGDSGRPDFFIHPRLPVAGAEVRLRPLAEEGAPSPGGTLRIKGPGGSTAFKHTFEQDAGEPVVWKPEETGYHTLRWRSADNGETVHKRLPVVWKPLYFMTWPPIRPEDADRFPTLASTVIARSDDEAFWRRRGNTALRPVYYRKRRHLDMDASDEANVQSLVRRWGRPLRAGADGIWIDEITAYPTESGVAIARLESRALRELRKEFPYKIISSAPGGKVLRETAIGHKKAGAVLNSQFYGEYHNLAHGPFGLEERLTARIETMRNTDLIFERGYGDETIPPDDWNRHAGIILLSKNFTGGGIHEEPAIDRMRHYVRHIKEAGPELPGIGFWSSGNDRKHLQPLGYFDAAEKLAVNYYVEPVLETGAIFVSTDRATAGQPLVVSVELRNTGGMAVRDVPVRLFAEGPDGKRAKVADRLVEKIAVGYGSLVNESDEIREIERYGNRYTVPPESRYVAVKNRQTLSFEWTPEHSGYYTLTAEIDPGADATILSGRSRLTLPVAGKDRPAASGQ